jgi:hypothetical protein
MSESIRTTGSVKTSGPTVQFYEKLDVWHARDPVTMAEIATIALNCDGYYEVESRLGAEPKKLKDFEFLDEAQDYVRKLYVDHHRPAVGPSD